MNTIDLDMLVGIPWKLNGRTAHGTDCIGILYLYYFLNKGVKDLNPEFTKLYRMSRDRKPCAVYLKNILSGFGEIIPKESVLPGDIIVFNIEDEIHAGILLRFNKFLHSTKSVGSCIDRLESDYSRSLEYGVRVYG